MQISAIEDIENYFVLNMLKCPPCPVICVLNLPSKSSLISATKISVT